MPLIKAKSFILATACFAMAAALSFAAAEGESSTGGASNVAGDYAGVWQWDTLAEYEADTGNSISQFNEAPMLAAQVQAGNLPPVEERLPDEPLVLNVFDGIGEYGGMLKVAAIGTEYTELTPIRGLVGSIQTANRGPGNAIEVVPYIHKGYEWLDELTVEMSLRRGAKWSDGAPYTADDVMFSFEDWLLDPDFPSGWRRAGWGPLGSVEKVDDYTVRLHYDKPFPTLTGWYEFWGGWHTHAYPKHYLQKFHPRYDSNAEANAKEAGYDSWVQAVWQQRSGGCDFCDPSILEKKIPSMKPWNHVEITTQYVIHERNPYHFAIDPAGNQLPYIDRLRVETVADAETMNLKTITGELDVAGIGLGTRNFPLYKENEEKGNYKTLMWSRAAGAESFYAINQTIPDQPEKKKLYQDVRFRQAMSLAINRDEVNKVNFFGLATPRQAAMDPENDFYKEEWGTAFAEFDPDRANALFDELGLAHGDDGYRNLPSGADLVMTLWIPMEWVSHVDNSLLIADHWAAVGIKVDARPVSIELAGQNRAVSDIAVWYLRRSNKSKGFLPSNKFTSPDGHYASAWWTYYWSDGADGEKPPQKYLDFFDLAQEWYTTYDKTKRDAIAVRLFDFASEEVLLIGTVGFAPMPIVVSNELGNFPLDVRFGGDDVQFFRDVKPDQWYFKS